MKKILLLLVMFCSIDSVFSQEVYFYTGKNFTTYDYKTSSGASSPDLKSGTGNFYELGINNLLGNEQFSYSLALALNEYNSFGGNSANSYSWNAEYLGVQGGLSYSILPRSNFDILPKIGINMATLISGKQSIDGTYYDLTKEKEFSGLVLTPSLGVQLKYNLSGSGFISFGYSYCKGFNVTNSTDQKLSFTTNQLQFGIHYAIN
jgi:hypothetical protein